MQFTYPDSTVSKTMFIDGAAGTEVVNIDELAKDNIKIRKALSGIPGRICHEFCQ